MKYMLAAFAAIGLALMLSLGSVGPAEAKHKCGHKGRVCKPLTTTQVKCQKHAISVTEFGDGCVWRRHQAGAGEGAGLVGDRCELKYGAAYGNWYNALGAHFNCKRNIGKATCMAIAKACKA